MEDAGPRAGNSRYEYRGDDFFFFYLGVVVKDLLGAESTLENPCNLRARQQPADERELGLLFERANKHGQPFAESIVSKIIETGRVDRGLDSLHLVERYH